VHVDMDIHVDHHAGDGVPRHAVVIISALVQELRIGRLLLTVHASEHWAVKRRDGPSISAMQSC
jgi:hypothetical protein